VSDENSKELTNLAEDYIKRGLSTEEAAIVVQWNLNGRPHATRADLPLVRELFLNGYSAVQINEKFSEIPVPAILYLRCKHKWDEVRDQRKRDLVANALPNAGTIQLDAVRFLTEVINGTHVKYREQLMRYVADPKREKPPEVLPHSFSQYENLVTLLKDLLTPPGTKAAGSLPGTPLVAVNISQSTGDVTVTAKDAEDALIQEMKIKKKK
jgi:hypothetical protein